MFPSHDQGVEIEDPMDISWSGKEPYYKNDKPFDEDSNHAEAIRRLSPYYKTKTYKYFKAEEVKGLKPEFVELLDKARELAGIPFVITSGYRTEDKNEEVGGVDGSAHTKGLAVDLRARNSNEHYKITKAIMAVGISRISRKYPNHIHCDMDTTKPQDVLF